MGYIDLNKKMISLFLTLACLKAILARQCFPQYESASWIPVENYSVWYMKSNIAGNWNEVDNWCRNLDTQSNNHAGLAKFYNSAENNVVNILQIQSYTWINGFRVDPTGSFYYYNLYDPFMEPITSYTNWGPNQPDNSHPNGNEDVLIVGGNSGDKTTWSNVNFKYNLYGLCEWRCN